MEAFNRLQRKFHHLAQFLAAFGNSYLPKAEDDSQSSMEWSVKEKALISRSVNNIYLSLSFKDVTLKAVKDDSVKELKLPGLDHGAVDAWVRVAISDFGLDASAYHYDLGFRLDTPFDNFAALDAEDEKTISRLIQQRSNAQRALVAIREKHGPATEIRVWPHHFDTGMLIDKSPAKDMSKGIGLGYAIADRVCEIPYFYTYAWPEGIVSYKRLPLLKYGMWIIEGWKGAILTITMRHNTRAVRSFYNEAVTRLVKNMR